MALMKRERPRDWPGLFRWPEMWLPRMFSEEDYLRVEEFTDGTSAVVRVEMPGIDPDKDVEITLDEGVLRIKAERRSETKEEKEGTFRSEFRYGSFERVVRVPKETLMDDVKASYKDGILEVRCPYKVPTEAAPMKVEVTRG